MNIFKKSSYTIILAVTFFIMSPFMIHQIWKNSAEEKKTPPAQVQTTTAAPAAEGDNAPESADAPAAEGEPRQADVQDSTGAQSDTSSAEANEAKAAEVEYQSVGVSYFDDALFIGDSRTVGLSEYGTLKNAEYYCDIGLSAAGMNNTSVNGVTFDQEIDSKQYGKIYLMLGINECGNDFESTMTAYRSVVEKLKVHQPDAVIYLMANLHVAQSAENGAISNANIENLNSGIRTLADNKRVFYIDVNEVYTDENGYLKTEYSFDGVHPYGEYYVMWCDWLCQHAVVLDNSAAGAEETYTEAVPEEATE
ncbi:MAG: lipase [Ruminococcus sp.]|nr:lipase [Ruminococcus sp.]